MAGTTIIDQVGVKIGVDDDGLRTGLKNAEAEIKRFSDRAGTALKAVSIAAVGLGSALAGFAAGTGLQALGNVSSELENIGVKAATIGVLSSELQEYSHVARRVDVDQEKLNAGLAKLSVFLGQARANTGPLVSLLKQIDPALLENLKNTTSVTEAFGLLADKTQGMSTQQDKLNLAQAAFSRGGTDLVRILGLGKDGIEDLRKEARNLGFVFSDLQIQAGGEMSDAIEEAGKAFDHQLKAAIISLSPVIIGFIDLGTQVIASLRGIASAIKDMFTTSTQEQVGALTKQAAALGDELKLLEKSQGTGMLGSFGESALQKRIADKKVELDAVSVALKSAQDEFTRQNSGPMGPMPAPGSTFSSPEETIGEKEKKAKEAAQLLKQQETEAQKLHNAELQKYNELRREGLRIEEETRGPVEEMMARQEKLSMLFARGAIDAETYGRALEKATLVASNAYADAAGSIANDLGKVFEGNKSVALATALINTYQSVTNAWANVPWPLNIAAAAAALAAGMAQVANIRKTTKGGGGGGGSSGGTSGGGGGDTGPTQTPQMLTVQGLNRNELFTGEAVASLVQGLIKFQQDGGTVVIAK